MPTPHLNDAAQRFLLALRRCAQQGGAIRVYGTALAVAAALQVLPAMAQTPQTPASEAASVQPLRVQIDGRQIDLVPYHVREPLLREALRAAGVDAQQEQLHMERLGATLNRLFWWDATALASCAAGRAEAAEAPSWWLALKRGLQHVAKVYTSAWQRLREHLQMMVLAAPNGPWASQQEASLDALQQKVRLDLAEEDERLGVACERRMALSDGLDVAQLRAQRQALELDALRLLQASPEERADRKSRLFLEEMGPVFQQLGHTPSDGPLLVGSWREVAVVILPRAPRGQEASRVMAARQWPKPMIVWGQDVLDRIARAGASQEDRREVLRFMLDHEVGRLSALSVPAERGQRDVVEGDLAADAWVLDRWRKEGAEEAHLRRVHVLARQVLSDVTLRDLMALRALKDEALLQAQADSRKALERLQSQQHWTDGGPEGAQEGRSSRPSAS